MSQLAQSQPLELVLIDLPNLWRLAASELVDLGDIQVLDGALPPARVATHALALLDAGTPAHWCAPYLIVSRNAVLGTCRFRAAPADGSVEIGYEVAESQRGRGVATKAVEQLLEIATSSGLVKEVYAHIVPENVASSRVVSRLGFSKRDVLVDHDGETVAVWSFQTATGRFLCAFDAP